MSGKDVSISPLGLDDVLRGLEPVMSRLRGRDSFNKRLSVWIVVLVVTVYAGVVFAGPIAAWHHEPDRPGMRNGSQLAQSKVSN